MSTKEKVPVEEREVEKNDVFYDFRSVIEKLQRERGVKKTLKSISDEMGVSRTSMSKMQLKGSNTLKMIYHFLKENDLKFEDLIREIQPYEK